MIDEATSHTTPRDAHAANAVLNWPIETIQAYFSATCEREGLDPEDQLAFFLGGEEPEEFWQKAKTNLQAERVRLVFVADVIPPELRRIVEFLNKQMDPAEVLAVEIRQFVGEGLTTFVPRVIGQTAEAERKKSAGTRREGHWDYETFIQALGRRNAEEVEAARRLIAWGEANMPRLWWGKGIQTGSCIPVLDVDGHEHTLISILTSGLVQVQFGYMKRRPPFDDDALRKEFAMKLNQIPHVNVPLDAINRFPSFPMLALHDNDAFEHLVSTLEWAIQRIREHYQSAGDVITEM